MSINIFGNSKIYYYICKMRYKLSNCYKQYPEIQCIYRIVNIITKKSYVGSTFNLKNRINRYLNYLKRNIYHSNKLQNSYNKYMKESFELEILKDCTLLNSKQLYDLEIEYIKQFNRRISF